MKSKVTIDVDQDNTPILKVEYIPSEDVRDKLVKKFLEDFGAQSCWARTHYLHAPDAPVINNTMIIRAVPPQNLKEESKEMLDMSQYVQPDAAPEKK